MIKIIRKNIDISNKLILYDVITNNHTYHILPSKKENKICNFIVTIHDTNVLSDYRVLDYLALEKFYLYLKKNKKIFDNDFEKNIIYYLRIKKLKEII